MIALMLSLSILASIPINANPKHDNHSEIKQKIANKISYPVGELEGIVTAMFTFTDEGELDIVDVRSSDPILRSYIEAQLKEIDLKGAEEHANELFTLKFVFRNEV